MSEDSLWEDGHSIFAPSYSATWMNCAGSLHPSMYAQDNAGIDAAIGTVFHRLMDKWLAVGRPDHLLGTFDYVEKRFGPIDEPPFNVEIDEDMFTFGEDCLAYLDKFPGERFYEIKTDHSDLTPIQNQGGRADVIICNPGLLDVIDWKYGKGVKVYAENNTQLLLYAWGAFKVFDAIYNFKRIRIHIAQPRLNHFEYWEITREELIEWKDYAKERAYAAWFERDRSPSPKACQWCKVRKDCTAMEAIREALVEETFEVLDEPVTVKEMTVVKRNLEFGSDAVYEPPKVAHLSTKDLSKIRKWRSIMEAWFADVDAELLRRLETGEKCDAWKIAEGRSRRKWRDEAETIEKLGLLIGDEEIFKRELISPRQAEKHLRAVGVKGKLLADYMKTVTTRPRGRPTLAPTDDARAELPNIIDAFDEIDEDEL